MPGGGCRRIDRAERRRQPEGGPGRRRRSRTRLGQRTAGRQGVGRGLQPSGLESAAARPVDAARARCGLRDRPRLRVAGHPRARGRAAGPRRDGSEVSAEPVRFVFESEQPPVSHPTVDLGCGYWCTINYDSVISSALAIVVTIIAAVLIARSMSSERPNRVQALAEWAFAYVRRTSDENAPDASSFVVPLAATLGFYILVANYLDFFPITLIPNVHPANTDVNQTVSMAAVVFVLLHPVAAAVRQPARRHPDGLRDRRASAASAGGAADGGLEAVRRVVHRSHPGLHLHVANARLFRTRPRGARTRAFTLGREQWTTCQPP
ncbi:MAG: hypothetical protein E6I72_14315 [Chloroflexi bacterium]|nr:MAG: hypothetical protein E6I72_14315 [Chloroflexota bacterium]